MPLPKEVIDATQGDGETADTGAPPNGADASAETDNGSSVPSTLAAALAGQPPTSPAKAEKLLSQEKVNKIAAKEREKAYNAALKELYARFEVTDDKELAELLEEGRKVRPAPKDKALEERDKRIKELEAQVEVKRQETDAAAIFRACYPYLSDTHDAETTLSLIIKKTGYRPSVKDGEVVLVDSDGDEVDMTVAHWLKVSKPIVRFMVKPTTESAVVTKTVKTKSEADAEARTESERGSDPRYRQREVLKILQSAALKPSSH